MNIKDITVINFGSVRFFKTTLNPQLSVIETKYLSEICVAIEILLCNKTVSSLPDEWVRSDTEITAEICLKNTTYRVSAIADCSTPHRLVLQVQTSENENAKQQYLSLLSHCLEQDVIEQFDGRDKSVPLRLCWYHNAEDYQPPGALAKNSDSIATTKTFRSRLAKYIKAFKPELINNQKEYRVGVNKDGKFDIYYPGINADLCLSETEEKLFLFICFLNIAEFWSDIESIRNLHHIEKPLLIKNFIEYLDESVDIENLIKRTVMLGRQVIIVTLPFQNEVLNKWIGDTL